VTLQIRHKNSDALGRLPQPGDLATGEIAVNFNAEDPFISIKDSAGDVVRLASSNGSGGSGNTLSIEAIDSTQTIAGNTSADFTISAGTVYQLLSVTSSHPAWIRFYGTSSARSEDTRTEAGCPLPAAGSEYYAEFVTVSTPETIKLSPVATVQGTDGITYLRVKNMGVSSQSFTFTFSVLQLV
jgi:hypothetical protein